MCMSVLMPVTSLVFYSFERTFEISKYKSLNLILFLKLFLILLGPLLINLFISAKMVVGILVEICMEISLIAIYQY